MGDISLEIVRTIAQQKGIPPDELDPTIYDAIDPDALECVLDGQSVTVHFEYAGYVVTVHDSGDVRAKPLGHGNSLS